MKHMMALIIALLVPTAAMAKGECKDDKEKFCKDVIGAKNVGACLKEHKAELSEACKTMLEARAKGGAKNPEDSAKMGKEEGTHTEPDHGATQENDTSKVDQPARRNEPSNGTPTQEPSDE